MRDEHLDRYHQKQDAPLSSTLNKPDKEEIQPLLFDLVKADKVDAVNALFPEFTRLRMTVKDELRRLAALSGSPAMLHLVAPTAKYSFPADLIRCSIHGRNIETFRYLLFENRDYTRSNEYDSGVSYSSVLDEVLKSDSEVIYEEWEKYLNVEIKAGTGRSRATLGDRYTRPHIIKATAGKPSRENLLLLLWQKIDLHELGGNIGNALVNVTSTTCSVKLAKFLIDCGAKVDHRRSPRLLTPLHHAARKTTAEAAEMMKFLLFQGADPEVECTASLRIRDEKGAKGISKWLNMSWDDLITKAKERQRAGDETMPETSGLEEVQRS